MPIDPTMADAILGTFRTMAQGLGNNDSPGAKKCREVLAKMEALAREMDDVAAFSTKLAVDNLYTDFSTSYGAALSAAAAQQNSGSTGDPDAYLMQQTLKAYEDALNKLKENPAHAHLVPVVQKVVDLGKSGLRYPVFLKTCEEQGVFLGMDSPHAGPTIKYQIYCSEKARLKLETEMFRDQLKAYEALCARSRFGYPDPVEWEVTRQKIEWDYAPKLALWRAVEDRWEKLIEMLHDWVDSFCSFAPTDERWASLSGPAETLKNIQRCQECYPGEFLVREEIFLENFGLKWEDIFTHETFLHAVQAKTLWYSDEVVDLVRQVKPLMVPGGRPSADHIAKAEGIHRGQRFRREGMPTGEDVKPVEFPEFLKGLG